MRTDPAAARVPRADGRAGIVPSCRVLAGQMLLGWAMFNLVEGIIDHHLLQLHHVRDLPVHVPLYGWLFLLIGGILLGLAGWWMSRADGTRAAPIR